MRIEAPSIWKRLFGQTEILRESSNIWGAVYTVAMVISFSLLVAFSKEYFRTPLHIPGHSAIYVIPLILWGRLVSKNRFGGTVIGCLSGGIMAFLSIGGGFILAIPRYFVMGAVIDFLLWKKETREKIFVLVIAGALANAGKFLIGLVIATLAGLPAFFIQSGLTFSSLTHLAFGGIGGLLASGVAKVARQIRKASQNQRTVG
ncbi:MAG: hypothetical protein ACE5KV_02730 [Thermoplasmata archaeon]